MIFKFKNHLNFKKTTLTKVWFFCYYYKNRLVFYFYKFLYYREISRIRIDEYQVLTFINKKRIVKQNRLTRAGTGRTCR